MSEWWKEAIGYQIYPRSFNDSNHDGIGDINGIREKLGYLKELGVDFIWLTPIYQSPNFDNGYDISDYYEIAEEFGTMGDFKALVKEAKALGIKIVMDLVINHTSNQHHWFQKSRQNETNEYRDYYIWHEPVDGQPPNDWPSIFGGSVWTYDEVRKSYYFHAFAKEQPDLNWNCQAMKEELFQMIEWWIEQGVDGFRIDTISHIKKAAWETHVDKEHPLKNYQNVAGIEEYLRELSAILKKHGVFSVGEASGVLADEAEKWVGEDGYFNMIFEFEHIGLWRKSNGELDLSTLKDALVRWQEACGVGRGWNALYMENHDIPRSISVYGNDQPEWRTLSGKAIGMMYLLLQGTPFIYQGQEIGMTNTTFQEIAEINATDTIYRYHELLEDGYSQEAAMSLLSSITRDNARTPMQWNDSEYAGFSKRQPWMKVNSNKAFVNVAAETTDEDSLLNFYKQLIELRKEHRVFVDGTFTNYETGNEVVFCYNRKNQEDDFTIIVNLSGQPQELTMLEACRQQRVVLSNYPDQQVTILQPYEARLIANP